MEDSYQSGESQSNDNSSSSGSIQYIVNSCSLSSETKDKEEEKLLSFNEENIQNINYSNTLSKEAKLCIIQNPIESNRNEHDSQPKNCIVISEGLTEAKKSKHVKDNKTPSHYDET